MTSTTLPAPSSTTADEREQRLVSVLGRASGRFRLLMTERWLFAAGGALVVAGIIAVMVGWVGTSRTVLVSGQIPYVVSGGLLGLALVFLGGFLYFGHWMALLVREQRERAAQDRNDLARLNDSLGTVNASLALVADLLGAEAGRRGGGPSPRRAGAAPGQAVESAAGPSAEPGSGSPGWPATSAGRTLVATSSGTMMHRPECPAVAGKDVREVSVDDGLKACGICRPLQEV